MNLKDIYKKYGGVTLLRQYLKGGAFWTAVNQLIVLGRSRTALEIVRLSATMKIKNKLAKKNSITLSKFDELYDEKLEHVSCGKIWFCWLDGLDGAPDVVKWCYYFLKDNMKRDVIVLTKENINEYVTLPDYIIKKYEDGLINKTHFSDLLRLELLTEYGGTWIDATVLCTRKEKDIPDFYLNSELFLFQNLKPGRDGHASYVSSWFITAKSHNKILEATKYLLYEYWKDNNTIVDYFLLHDFMSIAIDRYYDEWRKVIQVDNSLSHILLLNVDNMSNGLLESTLSIVPFHKLSYKNDGVLNIIKMIDEAKK